MTGNLARVGNLRVVQCLCVLAALLLGRALVAQSQAPAKGDFNPKTRPYSERLLARAMGNIGGWWSFNNEDDKAAFLDGYQEAMRQADRIERATCQAIRQDAVKDKINASQFAEIAFVCTQQSETADYDKVTVKYLDDFYSDPINQPILLEWSMGYLRDKASGRKTEGQLLDALKAEQKDVHDCSKYPSLCKLGDKESQPSQ